MVTPSARPAARFCAGGVLLLALLAGCDAVVEVEPGPSAEAARSAPAALIGPDALALASDPGCTEGTQPSGATYVICRPDVWNGSVLLYAHGYQRPQDGPSISGEVEELAPLANGLGFVFAATSYRESGLVILEGIDDMVELAGIVRDAQGGVPGKVFLTGASEGGAVTTLAVERHPNVFDGGLTTCGPCGDFQAQLNYFGDFRTVFDYFFPGLLPGTTIDIPDELVDGWETTYLPRVLDALAADPGATAQLLSVTRVPVDPDDPNGVPDVVTTLLEYNVFATTDAQGKLGGNPYDNRRRWYTGSKNDWRLNFRIARYRANASAREEVEQYETSGELDRPLVSLHTTGDAEVPFWHQPLYRLKTFGAGSSSAFSALPIIRYGHCTFTNEELIAGIGLLVLKSVTQSPASVQAALPAGAQGTFEVLHSEELRVRQTAPERPAIPNTEERLVGEVR